MTKLSSHLPALPLDEWEASKSTLHLYFQIVGKIMLQLNPRKNHWWYVALQVHSKGITSHPIPYAGGTETFEITFDFLTHQLELVTSRGQNAILSLENGLSVAAFYQQLFGMLRDNDIDVRIVDKPYDIAGISEPFSLMNQHNTYQPAYVVRYWRILMWVNNVFRAFSGRFYGKTSPVNLYWHSMDIAVTRFSGRRGLPLTSEMRLSDKDSYSHEVISFGFWPGDAMVRSPAFYSYTSPAPDGLNLEPLQPPSANWIDQNGSPMAILMYDDVRSTDNPRQTLLEFLESAYLAGAKRANWDIAELTVPPLQNL